MAIINEYGFLINNDRVFLPSETINVFPCSRRGQDDTSEGSVKYYDPEARLNTERTNRLHTAVNGFKDSFIVNNSFTTGDTLVFVLAGYRIEIKNFDPSAIADALGTETATVYAHLRLHNNVSLDAANYFTEMLYRQSDSTDDKNYLDVIYIDEADTDKSDYFFVGVSFTKEPLTRDNELTITDNLQLHNLPLFSKIDDNLELVQSSLLPKIEHGETADSIDINGDFSIKHGTQETLKVTNSNSTVNVPLTINGPTNIYNNLEVHNTIKAPAIDVKVIKNTEAGTAGANPGVFIEDDLSIATKHTIAADTLKVNTVNSRQENSTITIGSPVTIDGIATLNSGLEVAAGDATIKSSLKVEDNINVGTPTAPATADNGGYIVAKKDITAEQDLIAKRDIKATEKATVKSLVVGERIDTDSTDAGTIIAKKEVKTPQLRVNRITSDNGEITVDNKKLIVNKSLEMLAPQPTTEKPNPEPAKATIEQAVIGDLTVKKDTKLKNSTGKIIADEIQLKDIGQVPALEIAHFTGTNTYQLRFKFNITPIVEEVPAPPSSDEVQPDTHILTDEAGYILTDINDLVLVTG